MARACIAFAYGLLAAALARVRVPALVIAGDRDHDKGEPSELAALLPRAERAAVPGDHGGTMRTPALAESVLALLGRAVPPRR